MGADVIDLSVVEGRPTSQEVVDYYRQQMGLYLSVAGSGVTPAMAEYLSEALVPERQRSSSFTPGIVSVCFPDFAGACSVCAEAACHWGEIALSVPPLRKRLGSPYAPKQIEYRIPDTRSSTRLAMLRGEVWAVDDDRLLNDYGSLAISALEPDERSELEDRLRGGCACPLCFLLDHPDGRRSLVERLISAKRFDPVRRFAGAMREPTADVVRALVQGVAKTGGRYDFSVGPAIAALAARLADPEHGLFEDTRSADPLVRAYALLAVVNLSDEGGDEVHDALTRALDGELPERTIALRFGRTAPRLDQAGASLLERVLREVQRPNPKRTEEWSDGNLRAFALDFLDRILPDGALPEDVRTTLQKKSLKWATAKTVIDVTGRFLQRPGVDALIRK